MLNNIKNIPKLFLFLIGHWTFLRKIKVVRPSQLFIVFLLATLTVLCEAIGLSIIIPILSFIENGNDIDKFINSSLLTKYVASVFSFLGLPITLLSMSTIAIIFTILRQINNYFNRLYTEKLKWSVDKKLQIKIFDVIMNSSSFFIQEFRIGYLSNITAIEIPQVAAIFRSYNTIWMIFLTLSAYSLILFLTAPKITIGVIIFISSVLLLSSGFIRLTKRISQHNLGYRNHFRDFINEKFSAWKLIRLSNTLSNEINNITKIQDNIVDNEVKLTKIAGILSLIFIPLSTAALLISLNIFVSILEIKLAIILTFGIAFIRLMPVMGNLQSNMNKLVQYFPSCKYVEKVITNALACSENVNKGIKMPILKSSIEFKNVFFTYPSRKALTLKNISFSIKAGSFTAISGASGAGKSTIVDMLPRIIEPHKGNIFMDNIDIKDISLKSLRSNIAYIPQEPILFNMSLKDNLLYVNNLANDEELWNALKLANADKFVKELPDKLNTDLGVMGKKLSGGQRQRIVLARTFLQKPSVLILDEPTSALDQDSDIYIQKTISALQSNLNITIILIAHRLSSLKKANYIILIKNGIIEEVGHPDTVFKNKLIIE
jgi:ABC-type multidrug transport system fused ATPase/permease subunit